MAIDRRKHYLMVLDTETAGGFDSPLVYDIGFTVIDTHGVVYKKESYINTDVFFFMPEKMRTAYYAEKIPQYYDKINEREIKLNTTYGVRKKIAEVLDKYDIKEVCCYNARFDTSALNNTLKVVSRGEEYFFLPPHVAIWDIMLMAKDIIYTRNTYKMFCDIHELYTPTGRYPYKAETMYAYIKGTPDFVESHTGLEDALIEGEIFAYCHKQHKKMRRELYSPRI